MSLGTLSTGFGRLSLLSRERKFDFVRDVFEDETYTGLYYDFPTRTQLYQTNDTSTPVTADGQAIGRVEDLSPSNKDGTQGTSGSRGLWKTTHWLGDGGNDHLLTDLVPAASLTLAVCAYTAGAGIIIGASGALGVDRAYIRVASNVLGGGIGDQNQATITTAMNVNDTIFVALLRTDGATVKMAHNGEEKYSGAQVGIIQTATPFAIGGLNSAGALSTYFAGRIYRAIAVQRYLPDNLVLPTMRALGAGFVSF